MTHLELFKKHGDRASYHYADDSGGEWGMAGNEREAALAIFDQNPALQPEMRKIAKSFLWLLSDWRKP